MREQTAPTALPAADEPASAQTPVTRLRATVWALRKPAGFIAAASAVSGGILALFGHVLTLEDVRHAALGGWREILLAAGFLVVVLLVRHVTKLHESFVTVVRLNADAVDRNQRINEQQGEVLVRIEGTLGRIERALKRRGGPNGSGARAPWAPEDPQG